MANFENIWKIMKGNKFQLINKINNDLICNICNKLMMKSCNVPCGCKYCSDCIANYLDGTDKFCPGKNKYCQMKIINFEKDVLVNYQTNVRILEVVVKCPIKNCEFTDELSLIENHMQTCDKNPTSCPYYEIGCKNDEVMIDEMKDHLCTEIFCHTKLLLDFINNLHNEMESMKNEIVELKLENKHLKEELEIIKIDSKNNQIKNGEFEKKINNNLSEVKELNEEMIVIKNENRSMMNKLENIEKSRNEIESMKNEIVELKSENKQLKEELEIIKIVSKNNQIKNEEFEKKIKNNLSEIEELNEEMVVIKNENRSMMNKLENIEKSRVIFEINEVIERMQRKSEQQTREIDEMKEKCEQTKNKEIEMRRIIDEKFDKINSDLMKKSNINSYDEKINKLQMKIIKIERITEVINNIGEFEWKIENLSKQQKSEFTNIYSKSFYSHQYGYKMCLRVQFGWLGDIGDYFVYFHLMKGEFDNYLLWPFKHVVTIDIINQINGTVHTSKSIKYDDTNKTGWNKPATERNDEIYCIAINKSEKIIRNDQMLIKCKINI